MWIDRSLLNKCTILSALCGGIVAMLMSFAAETPLVIYNASGSAPLGFYYLSQRWPEKGELAVLKPTPAIELLLVAHDIVPVPVPLLKQVAATPSDEVCRSKQPPGTISVNGQVLAEVQATDRAGRPLPAWDGCVHLVDGEYFLLQPHPFSFDSRYFGPVLRCDILGVAFPIWTWNPDG